MNLFAPVALGRIAILRLLCAVFVPIDIWISTAWVHQHGDVPPELFRPVALARLVSLPTPTALSVDLIRIALTVTSIGLIVAVIYARGFPERVLGVALGALYLWWMFIAMSYGKVDHDRFGFLVLLAVLPTVGAARIGDQTPTEAAGWAVRMTNIAVVATYFLAAVAKLRFGGWLWANGATFTRAVLRRGTWFSDWTVSNPWLLRGGQWLMMVGELAAPILLFIRNQRTLTIVVVALYGFHLMTFLSLGIVFLPHLVALAAFLPLERIGARSVAPAGDPTAAVSLG